MQVSILMVRALAGQVERAGASRDRFLSVAGIDPRWIEEGALRLPVLDYVRAIDAAIEVSADPAFGLHLGEHARSVMFDVLGPLTEQAATLRESIEAAARYARLMAEGHGPELREDDARALIRFPSLRGDVTAVRVTAEFAMTSMLSMMRLFAGDNAQPTEVCFAYAAPHYAAEYQRIFGDRARFERDTTELEIPRAWLDKPQPYRSADLYALLKTQADRTLARLDRDAPLSQRITSILNTHGARPVSMDDVARELEMSPRSLRRRMLGEGLSYADLVTQSRISVAKQLLERPSASIQETAYAMGFASPAAFHRAFKRWTGMTPKQYRERF
jgi:AraC-like DNA-binding protein